jgi:hypothetical protein
MQLKDRQFFKNIYDRIGESVNRVNEKIVAQQQGRITSADVTATAALEQLAMQHQILLLLSMMIFNPGTSGETLPEPPQKIIGFK